MKTSLAMVFLLMLGTFAGVVLANYESESILNKTIHTACHLPMEDTAYNACVVRVLEGK